MKLYYSPGACSLSPHIALREAGIPFEVEKVNLKVKRTETGIDYDTINPKSYVPALVMNNGELLTEGPAIVQYIADLAPEKKLAPTAGTLERYRLQEWLNYISTEIHKSFGMLFDPATPEDLKDATRARLGKRLGYAASALEGKNYLLGDAFTVADAYLFTVLTWTRYTGIDLSLWPALKGYFNRVAARPAVISAMKAEELPAD
ncbi:MAG: glutathione transferase GstA [Gallionellales bacterium RIFCSPLOWO2_12_FULL_59_22]|nr:MAG: glutathione transferase GstA [Gallionellales bacterium RIFCSPLOWO2_02_FULL_59_110]OGT04673.1 MAG: glutathione transferase GstA [Gallionellales bacterium RIFCSPLOWO2_02_58_13]OGT11866.1 MAG: glutathione transferase GstA [Gallionellales bacterium RIFCSPLOWO2_12_FULL_59_22]